METAGVCWIATLEINVTRSLIEIIVEMTLALHVEIRTSMEIVAELPLALQEQPGLAGDLAGGKAPP